MCAVFSFKINDVDLMVTFPELKLDESSPFYKIKEDTYPHNYSPVIVYLNNELVLTAKRYALTPSWSKDEKVKWASYNARLNRDNSKTGVLEYIYQVPTWKTAFEKKHCLVPVSHFRESCHSGEAEGHIVRFEPKNKPVLFAAGIYDDWVNPKSGEVTSSFAIVTTEPDAYIEKVGHDRSPVFLDEKKALEWLKPFPSVKEAYSFLEKNHSPPELKFEIERKLKSV